MTYTRFLVMRMTRDQPAFVDNLARTKRLWREDEKGYNEVGTIGGSSKHRRVEHVHVDDRCD